MPAYEPCGAAEGKIFAVLQLPVFFVLQAFLLLFLLTQNVIY